MTEDEHHDEIQRVTSSSPNFKTELAKKLQELVPEAITDGKVDTKKLKELLDEDSADDSERFGLFWPGKKRSMRAAQEPTTATLKPVKEESKDWDTTENIFIEGDNLEVLKILQKHYHNKIKMIYIDPPYNTGNDFVYPDNYKEGLASYLEFTKQVDAEGRRVSTNSDASGRYHSNWLNMMYPRLKLARNLLTEDGAIFVSIGADEQANLQKLCSEVFGEDNHIATLSREQKSGSNQGDYVSPQLDYILVYARDKKYLNEFMLPNKELEKDQEKSLYQSSLDPMRGCSNQRYWIQVPDGSFIIPPGENFPEVVEDGYNKAPVSRSDKVWRWSYKTYLANKDELRFKDTSRGTLLDENGKPSKWNVYSVKSNLDSEMRPRDYIFGYTNSIATVELKEIDLDSIFDNAKPTGLIKYLIEFVTYKDKSMVILDFFSGSGTTADAVMQLNAEDGGTRKHIQVQLPEPTDEKSEAFNAGFKTIADISKERIRRAGEKIKKDSADKLAERKKPLDVGFKVFKLADTNFSKWQTNSDVDVDGVQQRLLDMRESSDDDATQEDLLTEILVKLGFPLTVNVSEANIDGMNIWDVSDKAVIAYLDERQKPTLGQLRSVADTDPGKIVILEDCFQGDDELKTNLAQICKTNNIELLTV